MSELVKNLPNHSTHRIPPYFMMRFMLGMALTLCALSVGLVPHSALATTFSVTTTTDSIDPCSATTCSLRAAVIAANDNPGADTISIANPGTYTLSLSTGATDAEFGDLDITDDITITGVANYNTIIDANQTGRSIEIYPGVNTTITDLTLSNGFLPSAANGFGSAIDVQQADLTLTNVILSDNQALSYGTINANNATVTLDGVQFNNNSANNGALMYAVNSVVTMQNSGADGNTSGSVAGIYAEDSTVSILNSRFKYNDTGNLFQWQNPPGAMTMPAGYILHVQNGGTAKLSDIQASSNNGHAVTSFGYATIKMTSSTISNDTEAGLYFHRDNGQSQVLLENVTMHDNVGISNSHGIIETNAPITSVSVPGLLQITNLSMNNNTGSRGIYNQNWQLDLSNASIYNQSQYAIHSWGPTTIDQTIIKNADGGLLHGMPGSASYTYNNYNPLTITNSEITQITGLPYAQGYTQALTVSGGSATMRQITVHDNTSYASTININTNTSIDNSVITNNQSADSAMLISNGWNANITATTFENNSSDWIGGALRIADSTATITHSTLTNNSAVEGGGGIANQGSALTITNTSIKNNTTPGIGGGIYNLDLAPMPGWVGAHTTLINSTVANNTAEGNGGGLYNNASSTFSINQSTISSNAANGSGGGIYSDGVIETAATTIAFNVADADNSNTGEMGGGLATNNAVSTALKTSIVSNNQAPTSVDCTGPLVSQGYLMITNTTDCSVVSMTTDALNQDPLLLPLSDNGGPTRTHAIAMSSPATNVIPTSDCTDLIGNQLTTDQRGETRANACEVGSYEQIVIVNMIPNTQPVTEKSNKRTKQNKSTQRKKN